VFMASPSLVLTLCWNESYLARYGGVRVDHDASGPGSIGGPFRKNRSRPLSLRVFNHTRKPPIDHTWPHGHPGQRYPHERSMPGLRLLVVRQAHAFGLVPRAVKGTGDPADAFANVACAMHATSIVCLLLAGRGTPCSADRQTNAHRPQQITTTRRPHTGHVNHR